MKIATIEERDGIVFDICWHPSGKYIAVSGADGVLKIFECKNEKFNEIASKQRERTTRRCIFSPDGTKIVVAGFDENAIVYHFNPEKSEVLITDGTLTRQDAEIKTARWSPNGELIVTSSRDKSVWVWEVSEYDFIAVHNEHTAYIKDAMFSPDGKLKFGKQQKNLALFRHFHSMLELFGVWHSTQTIIASFPLGKMEKLFYINKKKAHIRLLLSYLCRVNLNHSTQLIIMIIRGL